MTALHTLHLEWFSNSPEGVPGVSRCFLAAFPSHRTPTHPKPSQLGLGWVIVEARSSEAVVHPSPSWSNRPDQAWKVCLGVTVLLKNNGWLHEARTILRIAAECCGFPVLVK